MEGTIPRGARPVARVLLLDLQNRLFLLHAAHGADGRRFWVTPGGGLEEGEAFEDAARRELREETGRTLSELQASREDFAPQRLPDLVAEVIRGTCPDQPIECGV